MTDKKYLVEEFLCSDIHALAFFFLSGSKTKIEKIVKF